MHWSTEVPKFRQPLIEFARDLEWLSSQLIAENVKQIKLDVVQPPEAAQYGVPLSHRGGFELTSYSVSNCVYVIT
jgi:hypothetical protein